MNAIARTGRAYHRANVRAWNALRRSRAASFTAAIAVYLTFTLGLSATGHTEAAWIATVVIGLPLLVAGWAT
ncbi:hypothetical protein [Streptomyces sp. KL116D]|uniref:hypothetical protein n=1 Tax=Streptomyces sp. KL116D TaxID=3045152 RepID=UPI00355741CF